LFPDRDQVTMTVPFMRAYTELLVRTCHRRGAHAIGGMSAFVPTRGNAIVTEAAFARVRADKEREARDGFDGTWVAHPALVPVAREVFDGFLADRPNQLDRNREDVEVAPSDLMNMEIPGGRITHGGLRSNVAVGLRYLASWYEGRGAVAISSLMEDTATAEIARAQVWQWLHGAAVLSDGRRVDGSLVRRVIDEEVEVLAKESAGSRSVARARVLLERLVFADQIPEFLTLVDRPDEPSQE
jgi:malate synthase